MISNPISTLPAMFKKATDLESETFPESNYTVKGLVPKGLVMIVAKPKIGKSYFSLNLAILVASEGEFLDLETEHGDVLYFALEDNYRRLQKRTRQILVGKSFPERLVFSTKASELGSNLFKEIESWRNIVKDPKLIIIDTLGRVMPSDGRSGDYHQVTRILGEIQKYAFDHELSIMFVHHSKKNDIEGGDQFDSSLGSQGIFGVMDAMMVLGKPRMSNQAQLIVTGRDVEETTYHIQFDSSRGLWLPNQPDLTKQLEVTPDRLAVLKAIVAGNKKTGDIASLLGTTANNTSNKLKALEEDGLIKKVKHGTYELAETTHKLFMGQNSEPIELSSSVQLNEYDESSEHFSIITNHHPTYQEVNVTSEISENLPYTIKPTVERNFCFDDEEISESDKSSSNNYPTLENDLILEESHEIPKGLPDNF